MSKEIRLLRADEIEARVQSVKDNGAMLLLYKDARCDMNILDEIFGIYGWQREHELINGNLFCTVSVFDETSRSWIKKQDVGVESNTAKEKGQASDAFKRACFNWGIGRELYTAPFIWVKNIGDMKGGKCYTKFIVKEIGYTENREINQLVIVDDKGNERYRMGVKPQQSQSKPSAKVQQNPTPPTEKETEMDKEIVDASYASDFQVDYILNLMKKKNYTEQSLNEYIKINYEKSDVKALDRKQASELINHLNDVGK